MAQLVKDPTSTLLWLGFNPWLGNFCMLWAQPKKERKEGRKEGRKRKKEREREREARG